MMGDTDDLLGKMEANGLENYGLERATEIDELNNVAERLGGKRIINDKCSMGQVNMYIGCLMVRELANEES